MATSIPDRESTPFDERIHAAGVRRHGKRWFAANHAAAMAIIGYGLTDKQMKEMVPLIVLRVLDRVVPTNEETAAG